MNSRVFMVVVAGLLLLGGICVYEVRHSARQQAEVAALRTELEERSSKARELAVARESENERHESAPKPVEPSSRPSPAVSSLAASTNLAQAPRGLGQREPDRAAADKGGFGEMMSKMLQDPDMKNFIRDQQRQMMDQLYGPLIKQMGLTPEQADKFKGLLLDNASKATENASALFGGGSSNRTEVIGALAAEGKAREEQIKQLLGDTRYAQYTDYQLTANDRMQLNMYKQQVGADLALTDQQTEQLLGMMKEERQALVMAGQPMLGANQDAGNLKAIFSEDQTDQMLSNQEGVNLRVYERAKTVLSPEQLDSFGRYQTNQLQMMRMGMSMARKFLAPDKGGTPVAPGP